MPHAAAALALATAVTALQGAVLTGFGGWLAVDTLAGQGSDSAVGWGAAGFFGLLGLLVLLVAWSLWRRRSWAVGAALCVQLIAVAIAVSMLQARFVAGGVPLAVLSVAAGGALLLPATRAAVGRG